ncbi:hypothetical protein BGX38DRAFT_1142619 [Terfezia claveryi]|nr:hypothetical protein BGX38DRAFT_1142619 [Terfezia claveryi]
MRHSKYAPTEDFRYDGIYTLVRYWPEKGKGGFVTYKYQPQDGRSGSSTMSRRGGSEVEELNMRMVYREGKQEDDEGGEEQEKKSFSKKRKQVNKNSKTFEPDFRLRELIDLDMTSRPVWHNVLSHSENLIEFIQEVLGQFTCPLP